MVTVALAGATTGMGRTMLLTFVELNKCQKHKIVVFSRGPKPELSALGVDVRAVDYQNHENLVENLSDVHTVISIIGGDSAAIKDSQLALIRACDEAGVKRFAPSEFAGNGYDGIDLYASKIPVWEAAKKSKMECTRFNCGIFMSVLATGTPKPLTAVGEREGRKTGEEEALAGLRPWKYIVDMTAGTAEYPGDGTAPIVLTDMRDISTFVFRALDLEKWPEDLGMRGDVKNWTEIVEICERVQRRKWLTKGIPIEQLQEGAKLEDIGPRFYNQTLLAGSTKGWMMVGDDLNKAFPDVKPITCEEFAEKWWGGVELGDAEWGERVQPNPTS